MDYYGDTGDEVVTEEHRRGTGFLPDVCEAWESATAAGERRRHPHRVPAHDDGARRQGRRPRQDAARCSSSASAAASGSGRQWWSWISSTTGSAAATFLLDADVAGPVNLAGAGAGHQRRVHEGARRRSCSRPTVLPVPAFGPRLLLGRELADDLLLQRATASCRRCSSGPGSPSGTPTSPSAFRAVLAPLGQESGRAASNRPSREPHHPPVVPRRRRRPGRRFEAGLRQPRPARRRRSARSRPRTPIDTTVVVMQENRSVDHYLGWYARRERRLRRHADRPRTLDDDGTVARHRVVGRRRPRRVRRLRLRRPRPRLGQRPRPEGRRASSPRAPATTSSPSASYGPDDVPVHAALLRRFGTFDNYFCSVLSSTYPNREYLHSCQGIRDNSFPPETGNPDWTAGFDWPTIWDTLTARGVTWGYYFSNLPVVALWGARYLHGARAHLELLGRRRRRAAAAGRASSTRTSPRPRACQRRPPARRPPPRPAVPQRAHARPSSSHRTGRARRCSSPTTSGAGSGTTSTPPTVADPRAAEGFDQLGFRVPTIAVSPYVRPRLGRPRAARPHVDRALHRVELRPARR